MYEVSCKRLTETMGQVTKAKVARAPSLARAPKLRLALRAVLKQEKLVRAPKLAKAAATKADGVFGFTSLRGKIDTAVYADVLQVAAEVQKKMSDLELKAALAERKAALAERDLKDANTKLLLERGYIDMRAILSDVLPSCKKPDKLKVWLVKTRSQDRRHVRRPRQPPTPQAAVIPHGRVLRL